MRLYIKLYSIILPIVHGLRSILIRINDGILLISPRTCSSLPHPMAFFGHSWRGHFPFLFSIGLNVPAHVTKMIDRKKAMIAAKGRGRVASSDPSPYAHKVAGPVHGRMMLKILGLAASSLLIILLIASRFMVASRFMAASRFLVVPRFLEKTGAEDGRSTLREVVGSPLPAASFDLFIPEPFFFKLLAVTFRLSIFLPQRSFSIPVPEASKMRRDYRRRQRSPRRRSPTDTFRPCFWRQHHGRCRKADCDLNHGHEPTGIPNDLRSPATCVAWLQTLTLDRGRKVVVNPGIVPITLPGSMRR